MKKSLRARFFGLFAGLGLIIALSVGLVMYTRYITYIRASYRETLSNVVGFIVRAYPLMSEPRNIMQEGLAQSEAYYALTSDMKTLADTFNLAYIYAIIKDGAEYKFVLDSEATADIFEGLAPEDYFLVYEPTADMLEAAKSGSLYISKKPFTDEYGVFVSAYMPLIKNGEIEGFIGADYEISKIQEFERHAVGSLLIAMVSALALAGLIAFFASSSFIRPIKAAIRALEVIANGDLTADIRPAAGGGELADMTRLLRVTQEGLKALVVSIRDKARTLSHVGSSLAEIMGQEAASARRIKANTEDAQKKARTQTASVTDTNGAMTRIMGNIGSLNANIEAQARSVSQSSSAVGKMAANIAAVTKSLKENEGNIKNLTAASERGNAALQEVSRSIKQVVEESDRLMGINRMIQNIAGKTNLLAMNAAIEAAHAGAAGKGFAVVADEIRKLAESSGGQAKMVSALLKSIQASLNGIEESTALALDNFQKIDKEVKTVSDQETEIRGAVEEQDSGSRAILEIIANSNTITENVRQDSAEMLSQSRFVIDEGENLEKLTQSLSGEMGEIAAAMGAISDAIHRIKEISRENSKSIDDLIQEISKFKIAGA
ncbi:MAG: methyl-accepting chemotaxis protein [Spirochaetaceae bacterium]|nr:methyl-accepting chemotaxis protein [Spirochaetaceae bacterium]